MLLGRRDELTEGGPLREVNEGPISRDPGMLVSPLQCRLECKAAGVPGCRCLFPGVYICLDSTRYTGGLYNLMQVIHY